MNPFLLFALLLTLGLCMRRPRQHAHECTRCSALEERLFAEHMAHTNTKLEKRRWERAYAATLGKDQS
jgi:hypothetical protein